MLLQIQTPNAQLYCNGRSSRFVDTLKRDQFAALLLKLKGMPVFLFQLKPKYVAVELLGHSKIGDEDHQFAKLYHESQRSSDRLALNFCATT